MKLEYYQDAAGKWHWRVIQVSNGQSVVAKGMGSFLTKAAAQKNWLIFAKWAGTQVPAPA